MIPHLFFQKRFEDLSVSSIESFGLTDPSTAAKALTTKAQIRRRGASDEVIGQAQKGEDWMRKVGERRAPERDPAGEAGKR